ncbi:type II secretion system F family protein [Kineosporia sp. J2-2]|uniref:Type II secretion system F family protein n=1 Tax=Kineosporia corallincola TaxID=2835133 RepID=A0ABS5TQ47_9ACTN|nr:type II secretion system F family protein [Kineosporia corallincola]MBT0773238.1 type II secretion system F family protein [Kineosporia corallincola]
MTVVQIALAAGGLIGLGVSLVVWRLAPATPDLASALENLDPERSLRRSGYTGPVLPAGAQDRAGLFVMRTPIAAVWNVPVRELALLQIPVHRYWGEKALYFLIGLIFPPVVTLLATLLGIGLPFVVPLLASLVLAVGLSLLPDYNARSDAAARRHEFARALGAYVDLVALERAGGSGPRQAMEKAASVGDSWVFRRIAEELARSGWSGLPPWDALSALGDELGLAELGEVADIMRLSGEEGTAVYTTLRARSASMRNALMNTELAKANAVGERMSIPVSMLALVFLLILVAPAVLRVLGV